MRRFCMLLLITGLISCVPEPVAILQSTATSLPSTMSEAKGVLIKFFELLNTKQYAEAEDFYGGSYEGLWNNNPDVERSDHGKLLANACEINGYQCLVVRTATFKVL